MLSQQPLRVLLCPNAFKGSLTALEAAQAMAAGLKQVNTESDRRVFAPVLLPLADGGDGTLETLVAATGGTLHTAQVSGPLGTPVAARWGRLGGTQHQTGVIEMAEASGLRLLQPDERDPRHTTTAGTGELMRLAVEAGCTRLLVGIGGSATNDGGAGMATALGARLLDASGATLPPGGAALARLATIDCSGWVLPPEVEVVVACDVNNPLVGPEGASAVYGPQKGATPAMVQELDSALHHYADVLKEQLGAKIAGIQIAEMPGAGAAGGLGAGLVAFCSARLLPGTELALEAVGFDTHLAECQLVLTGEGKLDGQTARGKLIAGVVKRARTRGVPVIALAGAIEPEGEAALYALGLTSAFTLLNGPCSLEEAMQAASQQMEAATARIARLVSALAIGTESGRL